MGRQTGYRCEVASMTGLVQRIAVDLVQHGHYFYVTGEIPVYKAPRAVDAKLVERYELDLSKWARARRRGAGVASVQYVRLGHVFVLMATKGRHAFFELESGIRDVRRSPLQVGGYSISYRRGVDRRFHVSVRIAPQQYRALRNRLVAAATHRSMDAIGSEFRQLPFEPYAPVRRQLLNLLRAVNRKRLAAGLGLVPDSSLRLRRRIVRPFERLR